MSGGFWTVFSAAALLTTAVLGAVGWLVGKFAVPSPPEKFVSSIFEFQLPKGWRCEQQGTETVCVVGEQPYSAMCILAMKYRGPNDTFEAYREYLSTPREIEDREGEPLKSEVHRVEHRQIGGYWWVNGVHYQSEVPNYLTEYYATLTSHVAILVTFSVHLGHMDEHNKEFGALISSLKVHQRLAFQTQAGIQASSP
jgi:hypothetical protein